MIAKQHIPNLLTFLRVLAVPVALGITVWAPQLHATLLVLFVLAALTDFLDGYLARRWNSISTLGTVLDPIADKLLVTVMLIYLLKFPIMPIFPVSLILCRELYIAGLREFLSARQVTLTVSRGGKWKTALQLVAITALLAGPTFQWVAQVGNTSLDPWWNLGMTLLWISVVLSLASALRYTRQAWPHLR